MLKEILLSATQPFFVLVISLFFGYFCFLENFSLLGSGETVHGHNNIWISNFICSVSFEMVHHILEISEVQESVNRKISNGMNLISNSAKYQVCSVTPVSIYFPRFQWNCVEKI